MDRFSDNKEASFLKTVVAVGPMPPVAANTSGEIEIVQKIEIVQNRILKSFEIVNKLPAVSAKPQRMHKRDV